MRKSTILILAYLPYYLNDFTNIYVSSYPVWVGIDYAARLSIIGFLFYYLWRGDLNTDDLMLRLPTTTNCILWTTGTVAVSMAFLYLTEFVLAPYYPKGSIGSVPIDPDSAIFLFDSTVGLILVGFSEEIVCRGLTLSVLRKRLSTPALYIVSAFLFSLMHWSLSTHTLFDAFIYGLIFVPATLATGSIWPATITHFVVNFVLYNM
ncbi:CPBP family intramembrane metalloprotease [Pseudodesulfovibrio sp.]|nr:CPBP family intramembrane metalloprotease [Pseudodesulfovibrio sp.]